MPVHAVGPAAGRDNRALAMLTWLDERTPLPAPAPALAAIYRGEEADDVFVEQLANFCQAGDVLIAISASG